MFREFLNIITKSLKLDKTLYKENRYFGEAGIYFALTLIIIASLISIIPNNAFLDYMTNNFGLGDLNSPNIRTIIITNLIFWVLKSIYLYVFGSILFSNKGNKSSDNIIIPRTSPYVFIRKLYHLFNLHLWIDLHFIEVCILTI